MRLGCERAKILQLLSCCWNVLNDVVCGTQGMKGQCKLCPRGCNSLPTFSARRKQLRARGFINSPKPALSAPSFPQAIVKQLHQQDGALLQGWEQVWCWHSFTL